MKQETKLVLQQDVIDGFSYSFTKALLNKLLELNESGKIFEVESTRPDSAHNITDIAHSVISHLLSQIEIDISVCSMMSMNEIGCIIETAKEFLAIFEKEE
jgi:TusA-related sulfurtransferase